MIAALLVLSAGLMLVGCDSKVAIHKAAKKGELNRVKSILAKNPELVNAKGNDGWTCLHWAALENHKDVVEFLVINGAEVNAKGNWDWTPLHVAARKGHKEIVKFLISNGADVNAKEGIDGDTALHLASYEGREEVINLLITCGAEVNAKNNKGKTPQDLAVEGKRDSERGYIISLHEEISRAFVREEWKFFKGSDRPLGLPIEAFLKLVAVKGYEQKILRTTTSLKGYVQIKSPNDALSFVRLFTDLDTHYLFEDSEYIEVRPANKKTSWGELPVQEFRKLGLKEPSVMKDGEHFVVVRYVVDADRNIFQIQERISPSGDYQITKMILVAKDADILFPMYM